MFYKNKDMTIGINFINRYKNKNIIILPGWGEVNSTFYNIINYFKDYNIYLISYPSFNDTPLPNKDLTIYDYANIVFEFINKKSIKNIYIIAHSFGGRIASIILSKYNLNIKKLVLIDTAGLKNRSIKHKVKTLIYKIRIKLSKNKNKIFNKYASSDYKALDKKLSNTFKNIVNEDLRKYYKRINIDTLIIWGERDAITPLKDGKKLNKLIKKSALITFKYGTHFTYIECAYNINIIIDSHFSAL